MAVSRHTMKVMQSKMGQPLLNQSFDVPAPVRGIVANKSVYAMDPMECIYTYNLLPRDYGLDLRRGYREHANGMGSSKEVRTIMVYSDVDGSETRFAATEDGIYNITSSGTVGAAALAWSSTGGNAGYCSVVNMDTAAGHFLLVCDEVNGYHTYDGTTWLAVTAGAGANQINGVAPADLEFILVWKERVWFVEGDSGLAWYLPVGTIYGTVQSFNFGNRLPRGGGLRGLYNWTIDGGEGIEDRLVAVGGSGDVLVYQGYDPSDAAAFNSIGTWYIGDLPAGRRIATDYGGELLILSAKGVLSLNDLLRGLSPVNESIYRTRSIERFIRADMEVARTQRGWSIGVNPRDNYIFITTPKIVSQSDLQYAMDLVTNAWAMFRDIPIRGYGVSDGLLYFGDSDGTVWVIDGDADEVDLAGSGGQEIQWSLLTSFQNYGMPGMNKMVELCQPLFLSEQDPTYVFQARYDFDLGEISSAAPPTATSSSAVWDSGVWDSAIWGGSGAQFSSYVGAEGEGKHVAIAMKGQADFSMTFAGINVQWQGGGLL